MGDGAPTRQEGSSSISSFLPLFLCGFCGFVLLCVVSFGVADFLCWGGKVCLVVCMFACWIVSLTDWR